MHYVQRQSVPDCYPFKELNVTLRIQVYQDILITESLISKTYSSCMVTSEVFNDIKCTWDNALCPEKKCPGLLSIQRIKCHTSYSSLPGYSDYRKSNLENLLKLYGNIRGI